MRKMISVLSFLGIVILLLPGACKRTVTYTELDSTLANLLRPTSYAGVFIAGTNHVQQPTQPMAGVQRCKKACATKTIYWVQCTFPVTICYAPDLPGEFTQGRKAADSIPSIIAAEGTLREMVSTRTINGYNPLFCKTKYGPWIAEIVDKENCDSPCGEGSHTWTLTILGVQGNISWTWNGDMNGRPQEVQFIGQPWVQATEAIDCDFGDLTNCSGNGEPGGGGYPARFRAKAQRRK
jgi:hypothetical protein